MFILKIVIIILIICLVFFFIKKNKEFFKNSINKNSINKNSINKNSIQKTEDNKKIKLLYKNPDILLIKKFLTDEECDYIIKLGNPHIKKSEVCGSYGSMPNKNRTSMTAHIGKKYITKNKKDNVLLGVLKKTSLFSKKPIKNIEHIQLVRYEKGQFFKPHYDYLDRKIPFYKENIERNGQREFTFFVYLTDVPEGIGGTTYFPKLNKHFKCNKGDSLFWSNMKDGKDDPRVLHGGTELLKGIKYGLNIWVREKEYLG
jgi:prolyl 4-hydroxylase